MVGISIGFSSSMAIKGSSPLTLRLAGSITTIWLRFDILILSDFTSGLRWLTNDTLSWIASFTGVNSIGVQNNDLLLLVTTNSLDSLP